MDLTSALLLKATSVLVKKIIDDLYEFGKNRIAFSVCSAGKERAIARSISKITHVKTLWNIDKEVSLYEFYYPSQIEFSKSVIKKVDSIKDLGKSQNFVIQGTAGQGKSIFLRYLCGQELRDEFTSGRIPIFVELRRIKQGQGVRSLIIESLQKFGISATDQLFDLYAESGKFVLLLDAFDEIDPALVQESLADIELLADRFADTLQVIITSRPNADIQYSSRFRIFKLNHLRPSDHLPFFKKICTDKNQAEDLSKVISSSATDVKGLLTTPLMLTLLVMLYKSIQTVPDTVPRFYEELFDVLFYRHDHSKPGFRRKRFTNLDDTTIRNLFSAFCFYVRFNGYGTVTSQQLVECCELASDSVGAPVEPKKFKDEIVKTVCLMHEEGFELSFIHKSVAEYYAASFVKDSSDEFATQFYALACDAPEDWELVLKFLSQIDKYRHAKYFMTACLSSAEAAFGITICENISVQDRAKIENRLIEKSEIQFIKNSKGRFNSGGWSRFVERNYLIDICLERWLNKIANSSVELDVDEKLFRVRDVNRSEPRLLLSTSECKQRYPKEIFDSAINFAVGFLQDVRKNTTEVLNLERGKASKLGLLAQAAKKKQLG